VTQVCHLPLVLFDLDDTLFDHTGAAREAVRGWLAKLAVAPSDSLIDRWFALEARHVAAWHRGELDWRGQRRARVRDMLQLVGREGGDDAVLDEHFARYLADYEQGWRAFDDVAPSLEHLRRSGLEVAVLTNGAEYQQLQKLEAIGLADQVGPVFCSDTVGYAKPDPRAFLHVCNAIGRNPGSVVSVGDRYDLDVLAARAAGLAAVHLDRDGTAVDDEPKRVTTLKDLPSHL
jgi:putative hydrolase of the HAD superfamily